MSHVAIMSTVVTNLDALEKAATACGLVFVRGKKTFKWFGRWMNDYSAQDAAYKHGIKPEDYGKCDHAIEVPGNSKAYSIGVVKNPNGDGYLLPVDFYMGGYGLQKHIGGPQDMNRLMNEYNRAVMQEVAESQGLMVEEEEYDEATGEAVLYLCEYE